MITIEGDKHGEHWVWLVWGLNQDVCDLLAVCTDEVNRDFNANNRKLEARYRVIHTEKAILNHSFGQGILDTMNKARLKRSPE